MKLGRIGLVRKFENAVLKHFKDSVRIYGAGIVIPKHHVAAMHLAGQYRRDKFVLDTMPVEREHQVPKGFGSVIKNLDAFEKAVLVRCMAHQRQHLKEYNEQTRLLGATEDEADVTLSKSMYYNGLTVAMDDMILLQTNVLAVVERCGKDGDNDFFSCARYDRCSGGA
jgi:hypothetical protein